jgi:hypothetical protein
VILVHSHLGLEWGATAAERFYQEEGEDDAGERQRHFNPKQANIIVCDEDPTASLVEEVRLSPDDLRGLVGRAGGLDPYGPSPPRRVTVTRCAIATWPFLKSEPRKSGSHETRRWREMDSNFRFLVGSTPPRCAPR